MYAIDRALVQASRELGSVAARGLVMTGAKDHIRRSQQICEAVQQ